MEILITRPVTYNVTDLKVEISNPKWTDFKINGKVYKNGENHPWRNENGNLEFWVDIDNGQISPWENGDVAEIVSKVSNNGEYSLYTKDNICVHELKNTSVPVVLDSKRVGYGEYIYLKIDEFGKIDEFDKELILKMFGE